MRGSPSAARRIGLLIPSSNTVVEPEAMRLIPQDGSVSLHFSRLPVATISADNASTRQFEMEAMLKAALMLADAKVNRIAWAGTAASWLGTERDEDFVRAIESRSGIKATTSVIAINKRLAEAGARRLGLVTPYIATLESQIIENYARLGFKIVAARRLDLTVNTDYAEVSEDRIEDMVRDVNTAGPDAIVVMCTNLRFAVRSQSPRRKFAAPIIDSVAATIEACLGRGGQDCRTTDWPSLGP
jgi:maleate isomerase